MNLFFYKYAGVISSSILFLVYTTLVAVSYSIVGYEGLSLLILIGMPVVLLLIFLSFVWPNIVDVIRINDRTYKPLYRLQEIRGTKNPSIGYVQYKSNHSFFGIKLKSSWVPLLVHNTESGILTHHINLPFDDDTEFNKFVENNPNPLKYKYDSYVKMHDTLISKKSLRTKEYSG